jgi:hypothetical protein
VEQRIPHKYLKGLSKLTRTLSREQQGINGHRCIVPDDLDDSFPSGKAQGRSLDSLNHPACRRLFESVQLKMDKKIV